MIRPPKDARTGNKSIRMPTCAFHGLHVNGFTFLQENLHIFCIFFFFSNVYAYAVYFKIDIPANVKTAPCVKVCITKLLWRNAFEDILKGLRKTSILEILPWKISWQHHSFLSLAIHQKVYYWHLDLDQNPLPFQIHLLAQPWLHRWSSSHCWLSCGAKKASKEYKLHGALVSEELQILETFLRKRSSRLWIPEAEQNRFS